MFVFNAVDAGTLVGVAPAAVYAPFPLAWLLMKRSHDHPPVWIVGGAVGVGVGSFLLAIWVPEA